MLFLNNKNLKKQNEFPILDKQSELNFLFGVKVQTANLSLKIHFVVSGEGKLFTFAPKPAVIWQNIFTCNSIIINQNNITLRILKPNTSQERENRFSFKKIFLNHKLELSILISSAYSPRWSQCNISFSTKIKIFCLIQL